MKFLFWNGFGANPEDKSPDSVTFFCMDYQVRNLMFFWREYGIFLHGVSSSKSNLFSVWNIMVLRIEFLKLPINETVKFWSKANNDQRLIWLIIWKTTWLLRNKFVCWWITIKSIQRYILCISWEHRSNFEIYKKTTILHRCLRMQLYYRGNLVFFKKMMNFFERFFKNFGLNSAYNIVAFLKVTVWGLWYIYGELILSWWGSHRRSPVVKSSKSR